MRHYNANGAHQPNRVEPRPVPGGFSGIGAQAGRHRTRDRPASHRVPRLVVLVLVIWALGCVGWVAVSRLDRPSQTPTTPTATEHSVDDEAAAWIKANLTNDTRLLTDGATPPDGYPTASLSDARDWRDYDYLLVAADTVPGQEAAVAPVWRSSVLVAVFDGLQVRRILPTADQPLQTRDADRADRLLAGTALLGNPSLEVAPDAKGVLATGGLDLRAATALSALAGGLHVRLDKIAVVPAESAAGVPARSITVRVSDPAQAMRVLSGLSAVFRPDQVVTESDGAVRLHWPLTFAPIPTLH